MAPRKSAKKKGTKKKAVGTKKKAVGTKKKVSPIRASPIEELPMLETELVFKMPRKASSKKVSTSSRGLAKQCKEAGYMTKAQLMKELRGVGAIKGKRKKKDPDAPKRALSAYMFFANKNRDKVIRELGVEKKEIGTIAKELGARWREMSDAQKGPYEKMAAEDKRRYAREMAAYKAE